MSAPMLAAGWMIAAALAVPPPAPPSGAPVRIEGVVKDASGRPVGRALVMARALDAESHERTAVARTDAAGRFSAAVPRRGAYLLRIEAAGLAAETLPKVMAPGPDLKITLRAGVALEGVVRDARGRPVPNARVETRTGMRPGTTLIEPDAGAVRTTSDARGAFRLQGLKPGSYTVMASAPALGGAARRVVAPGPRVDLFLAPGASVHGLVRGAGGGPVADAAVYLDPEIGALGGGRPAVGRTDERGAFQIWGAAPGAYRLVAHRPGAGSAVRRIVLDRNAEARVEVSLAAPVRLRGRLVDDDQRAVHGAVVLQEIQGENVAATLGQVVAAESDAQGRFALEEVPRAAVALAVTAQGFAPRRVEADALAREGDMGDVVLERGLAVAGRVTDAAGRPIPDAQVRAQVRRTSQRQSMLEGQSGADGTFLLAGAEPGMYQLTARADGFTSASMPASAGADPVVIVLARAGSVVGGVVDEKGAAVPEFDVKAEPADEPDGSLRTGFARGENGRFEVGALAPGEWLVEVKAPDTAAAVKPVTVRAGAVTDAGTIRLSAGATLRGRVTDPAGSPVPGASVWWEKPDFAGAFDRSRQPAMTDSNGAFAVPGLDAERVDLLTDHPEYAPARLGGVEVDPGRRAGEVRIVLTAGGRVEGTVRRRDGAPVAGAHVRVGSMTGAHFRQRGAAVMPDGTFAVDHVPAGMVRVMLLSNLGDDAFGTTQEREVKVTDGEPALVDFVVRDIAVSGTVTRRGEPAGGLIIQVSGRRPGGQVMHFRGGTVAATGGGPRRGFAITRPDGGYEMLVDEPGRYDVAISSGDGRLSYPWRAIEVPDADAFRADFTVGGASVSGRVADAETGRPLVAEVMARPLESGAGDATRAMAGPDGRFALEVAPGECLLSTELDGYAAIATRVTVPESGASDIRLLLSRGLTIAGRVVDAGGSGVAGAEVSAMAETRNGQGSPAFMAGFDVARSGPDGRFALKGLSDVRYEVCATHDAAGYGSTQGVAAGTSDLVLRLQPGGRVRVLVRAPDGSPAVGASVWSSLVDGHHPSTRPARTDAEGIAEVPAPAGRVELHAGHWNARGSATVVVAPGETASAEIRLEPAAPGRGIR